MDVGRREVKAHLPLYFLQAFVFGGEGEGLLPLEQFVLAGTRKPYPQKGPQSGEVCPCHLSSGRR